MTNSTHHFALSTPPSRRVLAALMLGLAACGGGQVRVETTPTTPPAPASLVISQEMPEPAPRDRVSSRSIGGPVLQLAHRRGISSLEYSADGALILVTSGDGSVSLLDAETGAVRASRRLWTRNYRERPATFDATGTRVLIAGEGRPSWRAFFIWDLLSDAVVAGPQGSGRQLIFSPDARHVVGQLAEPHILSWTVQGVQAGEGLAAGDHGFLLSPTQSRLIVQNRDGEAGMLTSDGDLVGPLVRTEGAVDSAGPISDLGFRPNGGQLAVAWEDGRLELRHPETSEVLGELELGGPAALQYSKNGERLYALREVEAGLEITVIDPSEGEAVGTFTSATEAMHVVLPHPDGSILVGASGQTWSLIRPDATGDEDALAAIENAPEAHTIAFSPDGTRLAYADGQDVRVARFPEGGDVWTKHFTVSPSSVWEARWVGDDGLLTATRRDVVYWTAGGATRLNVRCGGGGACMPTRPLPDGRRVEAASARFSVQHDDGDIQILDSDYEPLLRIPGRRLRGNDCGDGCQPHIDASRDGRYFALTLGSGVYLVDARSGRQRSRVREAELRPEAVWVSETAAYYAVFWSSEEEPAAPSKLIVYNQRGREIVTVPLPEGSHVGPAGGAFHNDAEFALGIGQAIVRVTPETQSHESREMNVEVSRIQYLGPTGRLAVTSSGQTTVMEPVGQNASERFTYASGTGVAFSGDGRVLAHCDDGTLRRIDLTVAGEGATTELGSCHSRDISVSETGRFVAAPMAGVTQIYRADGTITRLTYVTDMAEHTVMLAMNERWGRFGMYGDEEAFANVMYRGPGPVATAPLTTASGSSARDQALLRELFAPPAAAREEAATEAEATPAAIPATRE